jgi:predicted permease
MIHLFASLWPLFLMILGGYVFRRMGFPNDGFWSGAERLNYFFLFPALLFKSLATAPLNNPALPRVALCAGLVLGSAWIVLQVLRRIFHWKPDRFGVFVQGTLRFNTYIGLATVGSVFGGDSLTLLALILAVTVPAVNVLSVYAFTSDSSLRPGSLALLILKNPLILACLAGVVFNLSGLRLLGGSENFLSLLSATSLPLGLLCVGAALQPQELRGETTALVSNSIARLLIIPAIAYIFVNVLGLPKMESGILVVFFSLPCAPSAYVLARQLGGNAHLMAGIITLQTLLSAITLPLVLKALL